MSPNTTPASKTLVKSFLKSLDAFMAAHGVEKKGHQAEVLGVRTATLGDWRTGRRTPSAETIARVSADLAAVERFLSVFPRIV